MQMSRSPASSARSASTIPRRSAKVWPKTSRPQPRSRTTSVCIPRRSWAEGSFHDRLVIAGVEATAVRRRCPATWWVMSSFHVGLQPELEQPQLPELVPPQGGELAVGVGEELLDVLRPEQAALARRLGG